MCTLRILPGLGKTAQGRDDGVHGGDVSLAPHRPFLDATRENKGGTVLNRVQKVSPARRGEAGRWHAVPTEGFGGVREGCGVQARPMLGVERRPKRRRAVVVGGGKGASVVYQTSHKTRRWSGVWMCVYWVVVTEKRAAHFWGTVWWKGGLSQARKGVSEP